MGLISDFVEYRRKSEFSYTDVKDIKPYIQAVTAVRNSPELLEKVTKRVISEFEEKAELTKKQREFWEKAACRWNIKEGATRSGKTWLDYFMIPRRIMETKGQGLIVIIGNTQGTVNRNILEPMRAIWGDRMVGSISQNDSAVMMFGKKVYILGGDKVSQVQRLQGAGIEYCYGDEVTTWNEEVFSMLKSRLDKPNSVFDGTCNPAGPNHWLLKFLESDADIYRQKYTIYDNTYLTAAFVKSLETEYAGTVYFKRFILGEWALAQGLVYPMFNPELHTQSEMPESGEYYISIDYGTLNPCSMGLYCIAGGKAYKVSEYYYDGRKEKTQKTDEDYADELEKLAGNKVIQSIIVDPSAASFITALKRRGRFSIRKANNSVLDGIRYTATCLSDNKLIINTSCSNTMREFQSYSWDDKSQEDRVIKENDHAMDEMRYFCYTVMRKLWRWEESGIAAKKCYRESDWYI